MLFCDKKWAKGFLGQDGNRLAAGRSLLQGLASTPRRRGVPFTRVCRRGLRSMSGHPAYAWGNPPTLRRSSFPQRASRPAGGPIPQNTLGALPQDPCRWLCWIRIDLRREPQINPYCAQNRSQGSHGRICPFPPPPFPRRERGPDGLATINREQRSRGVRACKNRKPPTLKYLFIRPIVPLL